MQKGAAYRMLGAFRELMARRIAGEKGWRVWRWDILSPRRRDACANLLRVNIDRKRSRAAPEIPYPPPRTPHQLPCPIIVHSNWNARLEVRFKESISYRQRHTYHTHVTRTDTGAGSQLPSPRVSLAELQVITRRTDRATRSRTRTRTRQL